MMVLSVIIGFLSGLAAVIIKNAVHFIKNLLTAGFNVEFDNIMYIVYPIIGIFITVVFIKFILRQYVGDGVPSVLYAISKTKGLLKRHNMFSSMISSSITVGFGGSVGLEGPTVATGAAIGSNVARFLHLNYKQTVTLLAVASAGAMSAIFKSPIAAIVFSGSYHARPHRCFADPTFTGFSYSGTYLLFFFGIGCIVSIRNC